MTKFILYEPEILVSRQFLLKNDVKDSVVVS